MRERGKGAGDLRGGRKKGPRASRDLRKSAKKKGVREEEDEEGREQAGRQMPGANAHRKHTERD